MKTVPALLIGLLCVSSARATEFMNGFTRGTVVEALGHPLREIETGDGQLLFYGSVFLEVSAGELVFINVADAESLETRRLHDAKRGIHWGKIYRPVPLPADRAGVRAMTPDEIETWQEAKERKRERVLETRVRRFLLTRTFRSVLDGIPIVQIAAARHIQGTSPYLDPDRRIRFHDLAAADAVSRLDLKDSNGNRLPALGESVAYVERHLNFNDSLIGASPVLLP